MLGKPYQMSERLRELIEKARHYKMTPEEKFEQRVSFVYGQQDHDSPGKTKDEIREMLIEMDGRPPTRHHQADDATVERVARALCEARGLSPDTLYEHHEWEKWPVDERREYVDAITGEQRVSLMHRGWRKRVPDAAAAIAAMREEG